jgi:prolyl-tRNA synthetase
MALSPSGEDTILFNSEDGYAANLELATSILPTVADRDDIGEEIEEFATPGIVTIEALTSFEGGAPAEHQIKTLVYIADSKPVLALLRGDHQLNEAKLASATGAGQLRGATPDEIFGLLGAHPGSLGAVGVQKEGLQVLADSVLQGRSRMTTGANRDGFHLRGVDVARDIAGARFVDLREAREGEASPNGGGPLQAARAIELGHVFKLGNKYSKAMNASVLDENGKSRIVEMGCYGIGVSRIMATLAEAHRDEKGLIWPTSVAPFDVHLLQLDFDAMCNRRRTHLRRAFVARRRGAVGRQEREAGRQVRRGRPVRHPDARRHRQGHQAERRGRSAVAPREAEGDAECGGRAAEVRAVRLAPASCSRWRRTPKYLLWRAYPFEQLLFERIAAYVAAWRPRSAPTLT